MKIHQLFREKVPEELVQKLVNAIGLNSINDTTMFCKNDLIKHNTVEKIMTLKDEMERYYLPCKAKVYLAYIDLPACVTIFRQVLRLYNKTLKSVQKYVKNKKVTYYCISNSTDLPNKAKITRDAVTVSFS